MNKQWYRKAWRRTVVDMHITDHHESFLSRFDPQRFVDMLLLCTSQSVVLYAHSHVGLCHYPTTSGRMHAGLQKRDIFGETVELCHRHGIAVVAYMSLIYDTFAYDNHPDWRIIKANGKEATRDVPAGSHESRYGLCCPNSGYRDYAAALAKEICSRYDVEGIRFDMTFWPHVCYCPHCLARFDAEIGGEPPRVIHWEDPQWVRFQRCRSRWLNEFAALATSTARRERPRITVEHQSSTYVGPWVQGVDTELARQNDFLQGDFYGGNLQGSFVKKLLYNLTPKRPFGFETSSSVDLGDYLTLKPRDLLLAKACSAIAHGGAFIFIDSIDPVGTLCPGPYERLRDVFDETMAYEPYRGGDLCADIAVYFSTESKFNPADNGKNVLEATWDMPHLDAAMGAAGSLLRHHIPFGVVTRADLEDLKRYSVLVLPHVLRMDREEVEAVRGYVRSGGSLYASRHSSLYTTDGVRQPDFMLADVFGASCEGETRETYTYIAPTESGRTALAGHSEKYPLSHAHPQMKLRAHEGSEVWGTLVLPYFAPGDEKFASIHNNPPGPVTDLPAIVCHRYGKGKAIYAAGEIERQVHEPHQQVFANLIRSLARRPFLFEADAPVVVEVTALHQKRKKRYLINLLNFQEEPPNIPVRGIKVRLMLGRRRKVKKVLLLPKEKPLKFSASDGVVSFLVPELKTFHMVAVEYR